jgi:phosphoglycerate dehydrogenase-like enzyme
MGSRMRVVAASWLARKHAALLEPFVREHDYVISDDAKDLAGAEVFFGHPDPEKLLESEQIRWVQLTSAGYTPYDRDDLKQRFKSRNIALTNSSAVYSEPCAEHLLMFMLAGARQFPAALTNQLGEKGWPTGPIRSRSVLLRDQSVLIVGWGAIGQRLAELLGPFTRRITALRRTVRGDEPVETFAIEKLAELLPHAEHVVSALPDNSSTRQLFDSRIFSSCKKGAIFYNVGRGGTVDQVALEAALQSGQLAAAYLDVCTPEPLPAEHPLWRVPNCYITPHSAGGHFDEEERLVRHFGENLQRFAKGLALVDRVY